MSWCGYCRYGNCGALLYGCECQCHDEERAQEAAERATRAAIHDATVISETVAKVVADLRAEAAEQTRIGESRVDEYWRCRVASFLLLMAHRYETGAHLPKEPTHG